MTSQRTNLRRMLQPLAVLAVVVAVSFSPGVYAQVTEVTLTEEQLGYITTLVLVLLLALGYLAGRMR